MSLMRATNWRRGVLRLWVVATGLWILYWVWQFWLYWSETSAGEVRLMVPIIIGVPIILLGVGVAAGWAIEGFRSNIW